MACYLSISLADSVYRQFTTIYREDLDVEWRHTRFTVRSYVYLIYFSGERQCTKFTDIPSDWRVKLGGHYYFRMHTLYQVTPYAFHVLILVRDVIPIFNRAPPSPSCMQSLLNQSLSPTSGTDGPKNHSIVPI